MPRRFVRKPKRVTRRAGRFAEFTEIDEFARVGKVEFVSVGSPSVGKNQQTVQRIGTAMIGGDFTGNARGKNAVDIQIGREFADEVASGDDSIVFGARGKASQSAAVALGYSANATGQRAFASGSGAVASGEEAVAVGSSAGASADFASGFGSASVAAGARSVALGYSALAANDDDAVIAGNIFYVQTSDQVQHQIYPASGSVYDAAYVNVTGDTMTGGLIIDSPTFTVDATLDKVFVGVAAANVPNAALVVASRFLTYRSNTDGAFSVARLQTTGSAPVAGNVLGSIEFQKFLDNSGDITAGFGTYCAVEGIYRGESPNANGALAFATRSNGTNTRVLYIDENQNVGIGVGTTAPATKLQVTKSDAVTNAVTDMLTFGHNATGTQAAGFGAGMVLNLESSTTVDTNAARIDWMWATATHASRKARMVFSVYDTAVREALRMEASGTAALLGFFGAAAVVQPGATTDLGTVLSDLGLRAAGTAYPITTSGAVSFTGGVTITTNNLTLTDKDIVLGTTTGTKIGTATNQKLGFYNATPVVRPSAYTQTYSTADKTLSAYTSDTESSAYTGAADGEAKLVDLNALRVAYENLRTFAEDLAAFTNSVVDDLQTIGLFG